MSQENVEVVRRSFEAGRDRRFDLAIEEWHPQGEWRPAMAGVGGAVYELRNGKIVNGHSYLSREAALEAVGLSE